MKKCCSLFILASLVALPLWLAGAQTTISIIQVESMLNNGFVFNLDSLKTRTTVDVGSPGQNTTLWDFSDLKQNQSIPLQKAVLATTPYASRRPGATNALTGPLNFTYTGIVVTATAWRYFGLTKQSGGAEAILTIMGTYAIDTIPLGVAFAEYEVTVKPDTLYKLPVKYPSTWKSSYADTTFVQVTLPPLLGGGVMYLIPVSVTNHRVTYTVDAYGTMKMPGGTTEQALRIKRVDSTDVGVGVKYIFVSDRLSRVEVTAKDAAQPSSGVIEIKDVIMWNVAIPTGVETAGNIPSGYELMQNYPNPFNPSTAVSFQLPVASQVRLVVYDLLGREVATLVNEQKAAGVYTVPFDATGLASGTYVYRVQAGSFVESKKMILMR